MLQGHQRGSVKTLSHRDVPSGPPLAERGWWLDSVGWEEAGRLPLTPASSPVHSCVSCHCPLMLSHGF